SLSGTLSPASIGSGAQVALGGASSATTTADASGNYSFSGLVSGQYTVTPTSSTAAFTPTNKLITLSSASVTGVNFTGALNPVPLTISGTLSPSSIGAGAQ